jgi:hypothetical protein
VGQVNSGLEKITQEGLYDFNCSPYVTGAIKSSRMICVGRVAHIWGRVEVYTEFWWGNLRAEDHFEVQKLDGRII